MRDEEVVAAACCAALLDDDVDVACGYAAAEVDAIGAAAVAMSTSAAETTTPDGRGECEDPRKDDEAWPGPPAAAAAGARWRGSRAPIERDNDDEGACVALLRAKACAERIGSGGGEGEYEAVDEAAAGRRDVNAGDMHCRPMGQAAR